MVVGTLVPFATPLIGMLMLGNLMKESGVVERLTGASSREIANTVTLFLGLAVGSTVAAFATEVLRTVAAMLTPGSPEDSGVGVDVALTNVTGTAVDDGWKVSSPANAAVIISARPCR